MLTLKSSLITPCRRFQNYVKFLNSCTNIHKKITKFKTNNKKTLIGRKNLQRRIYFKPIELKPINFSTHTLIPFIVLDILNYKYTIREFIFAKNFFGQIMYYPQTALYYPGFKIKTWNSSNYNFNSQSIINQVLPLLYIPINFIISHVYNWQNKKCSYGRSSGADIIKQKLLKKDKLITLLLPSKQIKIFPTYVLCCCSPTMNFFTQRLILGGWGYSNTLSKKIMVRGVAKNPVDHPNGGRTKAKQPELSPWGWIAKHSK